MQPILQLTQQPRLHLTMKHRCDMVPLQHVLGGNGMQHVAAWRAAPPWRLHPARLHTPCSHRSVPESLFLLQAQDTAVGSAPATISGLQTVMSADLANEPLPLGHPAAPVELARFNSLQMGRTFPGCRKAVRRVVSQSAAEHQDSDMAAAEVGSLWNHGRSSQCRKAVHQVFGDQFKQNKRTETRCGLVRATVTLLGARQAEAGVCMAAAGIAAGPCASTS